MGYGPGNTPEWYNDVSLEDGLSLRWYGAVFCNPPYSDPAPWVDKALAEAAAADGPDVVVLLLPLSEARWFHRLRTSPLCELFLPIQGRVQFVAPPGAKQSGNNKGSFVAVLRKPLCVPGR